MEEEDKGMSRSNPPKICRHAEGMESLLMRLLSFGTNPMIQESTIDGGGGSSSSESPSSSSAETLKTEPTPSVKVEDSVLMRLLRSRRKPMIQESTNAGVGDFSSGESPAEILKAEPTPSVNMEDSLLMLFLRPRTKPTIQHSANYGVGGSSSSGSPSSSAETLKTESIPSANFSDFDGFPELERQFSRENLQLIPTHFPTRDRTKGKMCREVLRTGSCSMGSMCSFSHHRQPPFVETERAAPPIVVERPLLLVPSPPPLRPLQQPPMAVRMPLRQFLQLQTGGASESCREEEDSASAAANGGSSTTTADTTADQIKVDSSPVGEGSGILSVSTQSAELPQKQPAQTAKYCDEEDGGASTDTASAATNAGYTTTTNADTKLPPTQTHKSSNEEAAGCRDTASSSTPGASITTTTTKADTKLPPAQTSKSSNEEAAAGSDTASSSTASAATIAGSSTTSTAGNDTASTSAFSPTPGTATSAFSSTPGTATIAGSSTTSTAGSGTASTSTSASSSTPGTSITTTTDAGSSTTTTITTDDWSPLDDGIPITREEVNRFIEWFLYDPNRPRRKRLPVFQDICTDADDKND